jgi:hypothetical protein
VRALDLKDQKFGLLIVLQLADTSTKRAWLCRCSCGGEKVVPAHQLRAGHVTSCGCLVEARRLNLVGQKFGRLKVVRRSKKRKQDRTRFECECACGKSVAVDGSKLVNGHTRSCGCVRQGAPQARKRKPFGHAQATCVFGNYQRSAVIKGHDFKLTRSEFEVLIASNCHYCGSPPVTELRKKGVAPGWKYNGVDRLDNARGYESGNVVPCCRTCNFRKGAAPYKDFVGWIQTVAARLMGRRLAGHGGLHR